MVFICPGKFKTNSKGWPFRTDLRVLELALGSVLFFPVFGHASWRLQVPLEGRGIFDSNSFAVLGVVGQLNKSSVPTRSPNHTERACCVPFVFPLNQKQSCFPPSFSSPSRNLNGRRHEREGLRFLQHQVTFMKCPHSKINLRG